MKVSFKCGDVEFACTGSFDEVKVVLGECLEFAKERLFHVNSTERRQLVKPDKLPESVSAIPIKKKRTRVKKKSRVTPPLIIEQPSFLRELGAPLVMTAEKMAPRLLETEKEVAKSSAVIPSVDSTETQEVRLFKGPRPELIIPQVQSNDKLMFGTGILSRECRDSVNYSTIEKFKHYIWNPRLRNYFVGRCNDICARDYHKFERLINFNQVSGPEGTDFIAELGGRLYRLNDNPIHSD